MLGMMQVSKERLTVPAFRARKEAGGKVKMITAYDFTSAVLVDRSPIDVILVGDSLGMVMLGYDTTTAVTLDEIIHHSRAVVRGAKETFIVADLPFGSYQESPEQAIRNATRLIKETGVDAVKLEGGEAFAPTIEALTRVGIPVMGHIGLLPATAQAMGGFKVQGRDAEAARQLIRDAQAIEAAGAFSMVLELIPAPLAKAVTERVKVPTIGIGAGVHCDGQVLVWHDLLGLYDRLQPRFVKQFAQAGQVIAEGLAAYAAEVDAGTFPAPEHSFKMKAENLEEALNPYGG